MKMGFDMQGVEWEATNVEPPTDGGRYATHSGVWNFMGETLKVHRLNTGEAVIDADDFERVFGQMLNALSEEGSP